MSEDEHVAWCSLPDHYVVHGADPKHGLGVQLHDDFLRSEKRFLQSQEPLRGLELFAGMCILSILLKYILTQDKFRCRWVWNWAESIWPHQDPVGYRVGWTSCQHIQVNSNTCTVLS